VSAGDQGFAVGRSRGDRPVNGFAEPRGEVGRPISFPFYGPWGYNYPWYGSGFGWGFGLGFVSYNPWYYGATSWGFGRYGVWYDPFGYAPYGPYGYGYGYGFGGGGYGYESEDREPEDERRFGSIRLRVNPKTAKVYIDGGLVGTVDEFDGLSDHLELEAGPHRLELKADGFETYTGTLIVSEGKTMTERVNLKKVK
jgi:PEGA domain